MQAKLGNIYIIDEDGSRCRLNDSEKGEKKLQERLSQAEQT